MSESSNDPEKPSKSQLKRDMDALQKLGEALIDLSESQLAKLSLPDNLLVAIHHAHSLNHDESRRRHLQYIGKLMREIDPVPIQIAMKKIQANVAKETSNFHAIEEWREKLISGDDTILQNFVECHPQADRQHLRQLIRKSQHDRQNNKNTGGESELFRYLRDLPGSIDTGSKP